MDQTYINMIFSLFMTIITGALGLFGKYLTKYESDLVKRMNTQDEKHVDLCRKIERVREDFNREALHVHCNFVTKEEYFTMISKIDAKLDRTLNALHNVDKTLAKVVAKGEQYE
mgnify:CR=1 FL=1